MFGYVDGWTDFKDLMSFIEIEKNSMTYPWYLIRER